MVAWRLMLDFWSPETSIFLTSIKGTSLKLLIGVRERIQRFSLNVALNKSQTDFRFSTCVFV